MIKAQSIKFLIRSVGPLGIICLLALMACGPVSPKEAKISFQDSVRVRKYEHESIVHQTTAPDSAIYFADLGLKFSRKTGYLFGEGLMLDRLAAINGQYGNFKLAISYEKQVLDIFKTLNNQAKVTEANCSLGFLEARQGNIESGTRLIGSALEQYKKSRDTIGMLNAYTKLGEINELTGHTDKALNYYASAEQLYNGRPVSANYLNLIAQIGNTHLKLGRHQQALNYFRLGIGKSNTKQHVKSQIAFLNRAGNTLNLLGNQTDALFYQKQSLQQAKAFGLPEEQARSLLAMAVTLQDKDAAQSIKHLKNALEIARSINHRQLSSEIYKSLSTIYSQQFKYEEALLALQQHFNLVDSIQRVNNGNKIAVLQGSYELAESKLNIRELKLINKERTDERNISIRFGVLVLVVLSILAFYFFKARKLNRSLRKSNQIKDKLFSIIGHDLRNPIGGITRLLAIMDEEKLDPEEYHAMVSEMRKQGNVSLEILNALLNWGEAQLKGIHIKPSSFNPKSIIAKNMAALHTQSIAKPVEINDQTPNDIMIYGDMNHFDFIIRNLLSNAIKFSPPSGEIEIRADVKSKSGRVVFSVRDHGKGISKSQQELFLTSNLDISFGTNGEKGTGIGLMLSKEFIIANHGKIWIQSEEGEGTTFFFFFPEKHRE